MENQSSAVIRDNLSETGTWELLMRPHLLNLKAYNSARDDFNGAADIWLDANELPYGKYLNRYPDPRASELKKVIAKNRGWNTSDFILGNGSDECIELIIKMFCEPGEDEIMICPPTYGMYKVTAQINNVRVKEVLLSNDFQPQVDAILSTATDSTKILFLCTPNNPTGNLFERSSILRILNDFKGIVVIDEAYIDFSGEESWTAEVVNFPRLIVLQTLSKSAGLAGLRVGICFARADLISRLYTIKPPYNLSLPTQIISILELKQHKKHKKYLRKVNTEKDNLIQSLRKFGSVIKIYPSDANFLLVRVKDAENFYRFLAGKGIVVRNRSNEPLCDNCLRISIGKPSENARLLKVWKRMHKSFNENFQSDNQDL